MSCTLRLLPTLPEARTAKPHACVMAAPAVASAATWAKGGGVTKTWVYPGSSDRCALAAAAELAEVLVRSADALPIAKEVEADASGAYRVGGGSSWSDAAACSLQAVAHDARSSRRRRPDEAWNRTHKLM